MQCIQATQSGYMDYLMMPLNHVISLVGSVATKIVKDTESIRGFIGGLRDKIMNVFKNIFGIFNNIIIGFQRIIIAMRDLVNKLAGIFATLMFILQGSLYTMQSMWGGVFGQMVRSLGR